MGVRLLVRRGHEHVGCLTGRDGWDVIASVNQAVVKVRFHGKGHLAIGEASITERNEDPKPVGRYSFELNDLQESPPSSWALRRAELVPGRANRRSQLNESPLAWQIQATNQHVPARAVSRTGVVVGVDENLELPVRGNERP